MATLGAACAVSSSSLLGLSWHDLVLVGLVLAIVIGLIVELFLQQLRTLPHVSELLPPITQSRRETALKRLREKTIRTAVILLLFLDAWGVGAAAIIYPALRSVSPVLYAAVAFVAVQILLICPFALIIYASYRIARERLLRRILDDE